ncbi:aldehyde dehydrogenase family protein [Enterovirga rhinocerotis]|uniref:Succinate-semialdehyde dehydrogenase/glutarate-semialdehyde dehydrogenase n=1 Tax=Enterovirga rhinocerotis TaxID=1339210 RepID=A0A4R7C7T8_9HYPH|nr:aldehyde dehydrogenase family protein [Enterovirga rhinocerotis]TDR93305.1 succinate-semialdehyde dehydrogenase/glutarate-semialdehyde dehydrogenase [Enterovirga rhinocerotis]
MARASNQDRLLIDGEWVETPTRFPVHDRFSGKLIAEVCAASVELADLAVARALAALEAGVPAPHERAEILYRAARLLDAYKDRFVDSMVSEAGFTLIDAASEVSRAKLTLELSAETAKTLCGHVVPFGAHPGSERRIGFTVRDPIGVVCAITPFNSPLNTVLHKIGPSFAAGNPTVLKPSSLTPLTAGILGELLLEAGMPKGFLHIVHGNGDVGEALLRNPDVAFYTFTGSTRVGKIIQQHAGLRRTQMELGSIASTIVCADADLSVALPKIANAGLRKAGQVCTSVQRLYVHESIYEAVVGTLAELARGLKAGDPRDEATKVGPLISLQAAERGEAWIRDAVAAGATLHCGGTREGSVITPAVLTDVPESCEAWCREAFAPLIVVRPFKDLKQAIDGANDTPFGLAAGVFTKNMDIAMQAMRTLRFGTVQINETSSARADVMPFGGVKESGFGKEGPAYAAVEMSLERLIVLNP